MKHTKSQTVGVVMLWATLLASVVGGCGPAPTPPGAVLAGTWSVTAEGNPDLKQLLFTFDSNGQLSNVTYQVGSNATISASYPAATTDVNGTNVTISSTFLNNTLSFTGTLNSANTVITGTLTTQITVGGIVITVNNGAATLRKL